MMVWAPVLEAVCPMIIVRALRQQKPPWLSEVSLLPYRVTKYRSYVQYVLLRASNTACCVSLAAQQFSHNLSVSQVCWLPVAIMFCVFPIQSTWKNNKIEGIRCLHAILVIDILLCGILVFSADLRIVIRCAIWLP